METCSHRSTGRTPLARQVKRDLHVLAVAERLAKLCIVWRYTRSSMNCRLLDRETGRKPGRRWTEEGGWRALLEQILAPAPACVADVFVACLMKEHRPHRIIDEVARRVVARFAEQVGALNQHAAGIHAE